MISVLAVKEQRSTVSLNNHIGNELHQIEVMKATVFIKEQYKPLIDAACRKEKIRLYEDRRQTINAIKS